MNVAVITNLNGIGLQKDWELLSQYLRDLGHSSWPFQYDKPIEEYGGIEHFDLTIFLEVIPLEYMDVSDRRWYVANPEWVKPETIQTIARNCELVLTKTKEGQRLLEPLFPGKTKYIGWPIPDKYDESVKRERSFLCIGGNSAYRGVQAVIDAWQWEKNGKKLDAKLCIVSNVIDVPKQDNIFWWKRMAEKDLKILQNKCAFHIYPSLTEGFGLAMHESYGVGAQLITTDGPPMNETLHALHLPAAKVGKFNLADLYEVSALDIYNAVEQYSRYEPRVDQLSRDIFEQNNASFKTAFKAILDAPPPTYAVRRVRKAGDARRIAFLGNFDAAESTENQILWALEQRLGYVVERLQEDSVSYRLLEEAIEWNDIFMWVHTRGFLKVSDDKMLSLIRKMNRQDMPSYSLHLDKYLGIPEREAVVGKHPFWLTSQVWTADGSDPDWFARKGVKHFWMRPAVSEVYCHPGTPREQYKCDVMFCGARGYHKEYPFREHLIDFLEKEYGERFKHIQGVRGHELNDTYASAKVIVGDHIFAGIPRYESDRAVETMGRGGFLLYPKTEGIYQPCATYEPQNLDDLKRQIDYWLPLESSRKATVWTCMLETSKHDTWSVRLKEVLQ